MVQKRYRSLLEPVRRTLLALVRHRTRLARSVESIPRQELARRSKTLAWQGGDQHANGVRPKYGGETAHVLAAPGNGPHCSWRWSPQGAVCSTKIVHQPDVRSRPCQQCKDWHHCAIVSDGARLRCRSNRVEVRRRRVHVHQVTEQT